LIDYIKCADIYIDTFPSGGGVIVLMAKSLAVPIVTFEDDNSAHFDQNSWNPAANYLPGKNYIISRWNFELMKIKIQFLIDNQNLRISFGEECRIKYIKDYSNPQRMIQSYEELILEFFKK
jgi:hypothetical protein